MASMNKIPTPSVTGLLAGTISLFLGFGVVWIADQNDLERAKARAHTEFSDHATRVQTTISTALSSTYALGALVRQGGGAIDDFDAIAAQLMPFYPGVGSLQTAPQGVVQQVYPLKGNEKAIGHDLLADPTRTKEAFLARDTGTLTLAGPFNLVQGGVGAVGRLPVFLKGEKGERSEFWGFTSALIRFPQVLQDVHFDKLPQLGYQYSLWRIHPDTQETQVIASSLPEGTLNDPLAYQLRMPNGEWTLSVAPTNGWRNLERTSINLLLTAFVSVLLGWLAKQMAELRLHRASLASQVDDKTRELREEVTQHRVTSEQLQKLSLAVEQSPASIVIADLDGDIEYVNEAFVRKTGYSRDEVIGKNPRLLQSGRTPPGHYRQLWDDLTQGRVWSGEFCNRTKDGKEYTEWATVAPIKQPDGKITHYVAVKDDITEKRRMAAELDTYRLHLEELVQQRTHELEATEARATGILESAADGLYGVDQQGVITFINPAACSLLGYSAKQAIGQIAHDLFHHSKPDGSPYPLASCRSHGAISSGEELRSDDEVYWHADGHPVPVMIAIHPMVQNGEVTGAVISLVDNGEQRAAAAAREAAIVAAENLARARSEFLANMSHEIRTPINAVLGLAQIGYRNFQDVERSKDAFEKILASGNRLLGVINDALDFSKIEAGKLHIEHTKVILKDVIYETGDVVTELARAKHLQLRLECAPNLPTTCISDPLRIGQVLLNLLSNAIKFTETGSVTLAASLEEERLLFSIADTGIGMSEQQIRQLFVPFHQVDGSVTRRFGGTGLGLVIAKRIAELLEGDIRVWSQPGKGSTFEFRLPYRPSDDVPAPPTLIMANSTDQTDRCLAGISILVAEDNEINQEILEINLVEAGAKVVMVANGRQAVDRVLQDGGAAFDIVLMDMQMPVLGGLDATRLILDIAPSLPIIGQTANAFREDQEKCLAAGMVGHIAKPIDYEALFNLILQHVSARH